MVRFDTACINTDFWENKKYGRYYPGLPRRLCELELNFFVYDCQCKEICLFTLWT